MMKRHIGMIRRIAVVLVSVIAIVYFYPHPKANYFNYEEGRPWNYAKLIAPFDIPIHPDSATLLKARDTLDAHFVPVYELNQLAIDTIIRSLPRHNDVGIAQLTRELRRMYAGGVVDGETQDKIDAGSLPKVRILEGNILSEMSTSGFTSPRKIYVYLDSVISDPDLKRYIADADLPELLKPNVIYNAAESKRHYDYDYLTLTADRGVIQQGQTIIDKGNIISAQDFTNLQTYEQMMSARLVKESSSTFLMWLGQFMYVALLFAALLLYIRYNCREIYDNMKAVVFVLVLVTLFFMFALLMNTIVAGGIYIVPFMIVPILLLVFFDSRTALFVSIVLTLVCAGITSYALEFILLQFCASVATLNSLKQLSRRAELLRVSSVVAVIYIVAYVSLELMMNGTFEGFVWRMPAFLIVNALLTCMAYILMFAVERVFGFVSVVTLVELSDTNSPLLQKLSDQCPGTFQHSLAVSNLAGDAARAVGANVPLVRAGGLYHDIGKLNNPAFFTENQHGVNPHDSLSPERSAQIVISHVTDGVKRADKAGLPEVIKDFIREHHGRGKAKYFYFTACKMSPDTEIDEAPFTYPGPNPRSRETSVLMMADAVEAASRSLSEHTKDAIVGLVNKIVDGQIADGLHNDSTLEFKDVRAIKDAFVKRLITLYHSRIAYPSAPSAVGDNKN